MIYKPRTFSIDNSPICTYTTSHIDPVLNTRTDVCSKTCLVKINTDYPKPDEFKDIIIQSTHYKTQFSLNENPLSENCIIDKATCELIYSTFELTRPVTRVANYVEYLKLSTDFTSKINSLYTNTNLINWYSRMTAYKNIIDTGAVSNMGDEVFGNASTEWIIKHNLGTYNIICQSFGKKNEMIYPDKQFPIDENTYMISWGKSNVGGFALLSISSVSAVWTLLENKPFTVVHNLHMDTAPDLIQMQNMTENREREEPLEFIEDKNTLIVHLLDKFKSDANILINVADAYFYIQTPAKKWHIKHNMNMLGVHAQIYNEAFEAIQASEIYLTNNNTVDISFDVPTSGYIGFKKIGNPFWKNEIIDGIVEKDENGNYLGKFAVTDLSGINFDRNYGQYFYKENSQKKMQSKDIQYFSISDFYETKDKYVFEFVINTNDIESININEIGLFDKNNQLCFYSCGDSIYYPKEFSFRHEFVIYKEAMRPD